MIRIKGIDLYDHQKAVVKTFDEMEPGGTLIVKSSRQKGKTILLENMLLRQSINYPNTTSICVEPSWAQSGRVFRAIVKACEKTGVVSGSNGGSMIINFKNGSEIQFLSGAQKVDSVRGATVSKHGILAFDEAAFLKDEFIYKCIPFRNANKAKIVSFSTPLFKEGYFWREYKGALEGMKGNYVVDFNDFDTSMLYPPEQREHDRLTMPPLIYMTEVMGEFIDGFGSVFGNLSSLLETTPTDPSISSMGIDWGTGKNKDYTAIVGFNSQKQMVLCEGWNDVPPSDQVDKIKQIIQRTNPRLVTVETNSIGEVYYDMLKKALPGVQIKGFVTTNESKRRIIENLSVACNNHDITILDHPLLKLHMSAYEAEPTPTGKITYNGQNNTHDDFVIATALAYEGLSKNTNYIFASR